jgi:serine/threonine-protein phosphatase 2B regulatory subunit
VVDPTPGVEKLFQLFDKDKSGHIDVKEFFVGLSNFTGAGKDDKLKFAFSVFDDNGDGVITRVSGISCWRACCVGAHRAVCNSFSSACALRTAPPDAILQDELIKILKANHMASSDKEVLKKAETILAQADKDGDGVINFDEFVLVSKRFPNILYPSVSAAARCNNVKERHSCWAVHQICSIYPHPHAAHL